MEFTNDEKGVTEIVVQYAVEIHNLRKVYRVGEEKVIALDDISLQIEKGEICCILGTSGSGKSTLLNLMAGLEKPTRGRIVIQGFQIEDLNEKQLARFRQKNIGFIFQAYNLLPALSALENVSLPLLFRGVPPKIRHKQALKMLEAVGLKSHLHHKPSQLSGGQQQRVGIARAFVCNAPIVFADEPTGNLDSKTSYEVMQLMVQLADQHQQNLVIVTHDVNVANYADKIIHILDGRIEQIENKKIGEDIGHEV